MVQALAATKCQHSSQPLLAVQLGGRSATGFHPPPWRKTQPAANMGEKNQGYPVQHKKPGNGPLGNPGTGIL